MARDVAPRGRDLHGPCCAGRLPPPRGPIPRGWRRWAVLDAIEARVVDEVGNMLPTRGWGYRVRGGAGHRATSRRAYSCPPGATAGMDTGDLGYLTENAAMWYIGRGITGRHHHAAGRSIYTTDSSAQPQGRGCRRACGSAVRLEAGQSRESFAVAVDSNAFEEPGPGAPDSNIRWPLRGSRG